jgi:cytochrome c oxidase cbb3-type subunit 3
VATRPDQLLEHEADGIREFDNQLPRWWLYGFYFTILFSAVAEYEAEVAAAATLAAGRPKPAAPAAVAAASDEETLKKGESIFNSQTSLCASCHRPDLGGLVGPDLTDDLWLHGCSVSEVVASIRTGYPTRGMLPYGSNSVLDDEQLRQVASFILSRRGSGPPNPKPPDPERDKTCS